MSSFDAAQAKAADDFFEVWGGISGWQSTLQPMLTAGHGGRGMPLSKIASVCSGDTARRFGPPGKGRIEAGLDADLAPVDLDAEHVLRAEDLFQRHAQSPYLGRRSRDRISGVLARGTAVFAGGKMASGAVGRLVRPAD